MGRKEKERGGVEILGRGFLSHMIWGEWTPDVVLLPNSLWTPMQPWSSPFQSLVIVYRMASKERCS